MPISSRKLTSLPRHQKLRKMAKMFGEAEILFGNSGRWTYPLDDLVSALNILALDAEFPPDIAPFVSSAIADANSALQAAWNTGARGGISDETLRRRIKNPRSKLRGIEDFSLKSLRMWGNKSPTPPVFRSKLRGIKPKEI
jgi:hypothetical protein